MEMASLYAKGLVENLLSVIALTNMHRASGKDEYRRSAEKWVPILEGQLEGLKRELAEPLKDEA